MPYEPCPNCGGTVADDKPQYIPLGTDTVIGIVDQVCKDCKTAIIGPNQRTRFFRDKKLHDELVANLNDNVNKERSRKERP